MKLKIIFTTFILLLWTHVYACKCNGPGTVKESYPGAAVVVHGKVVSKKVVSFASTMKVKAAGDVRKKLASDAQKLQLFESNFIFEIKLQVIEKFKGNVGDTVILYTTINGASCGYQFETEKQYIVYAYAKSHSYRFFLTEPERNGNFEKENTYWTNHCTRTAVYYKSEADELRKIKG
jgi:hypothetical protein